MEMNQALRSSGKAPYPPSEVAEPFITFMLEQVQAVLKERNDQVKDIEMFKLVLGGPTVSKTVRELNVFECDMNTLSELDYAVYYTLNIILHFIENKGIILNRNNPAYTEIYFKIFDNIFKLGLKDSTNGEPIDKVEALSELHLGWIRGLKTKFPAWRAVQTYIELTLKPEFKKEMISQLDDCLNVKEFCMEDYKYWKFVITYWKLHATVNLSKMCMNLAFEKSYDIINDLVGKYTKWEIPEEELLAFKTKLVRETMASKRKGAMSTGASLHGKLNLSIEGFPEIVHQQNRNGVYYFAMKLFKKKDDPEYLPLNRIEEYFFGCPDLMIHLVVILWNDKKKDWKHAAKGIYIRNNLTA